MKIKETHLRAANNSYSPECVHQTFVGHEGRESSGVSPWTSSSMSSTTGSIFKENKAGSIAHVDEGCLLRRR